VRSSLLVIVASIPLAVVAYAVWWGLDEALGRTFLAQLVSVFTALAAGGAVYLISARLLGIRELQALLSLRSRPRPDV
jgi:hypothetical protein